MAHLTRGDARGPLRVCAMYTTILPVEVGERALRAIMEGARTGEMTADLFVFVRHTSVYAQRAMKQREAEIRKRQPPEPSVRQMRGKLAA